MQSLPHRTSAAVHRPGRLALLALGIGLGIGTGFVSLHAQYPGHAERKVKQGPVLRAVAVLEWSGEPRQAQCQPSHPCFRLS